MTLFPTVLFTASGGDPGTFLTSARNIGLPIRRFEKKDGTFCGEVSAFRYRDAAQLARKSGLRLRAKGRAGLLYRLFFYRRRLGLLVGIMLFFVGLLFSQNFLWAIDVDPSPGVTESQVLAVLAEQGVRIGAYLPRTDLKAAALRARTELPGLSFFALNRIGSRVQAEMADADPPPQRPISSGTSPCNIVASREGILRQLEPYRGQTVARVGQSVAKGQLLVSGVVENADGRTSYQHASARILAETTRQKTFTLTLRQTHWEETGEQKARFRLDLFGRKWPLFLALPKFQTKEPYESRFQMKEYRFGSFAVGVEKETQIFLKEATNVFTEEEALLQLEATAESWEKTLPGEMLSRECAAVCEDGEMTLTVTCILLEDIAKERPFDRQEALFSPEKSS